MRLAAACAVAFLGMVFAVTPGSSSWAAPTFAAERLDLPGEVLDLSKELGRRPIVLYFWASWCEACKAEAPLLESAWRRYRDRALFVGIDLQDTRKGGRPFMESYRWTFPNVRDPHGNVARSYRIAGIPTTVFIDASGQIVALWTGPLDAERLDTFLEALIGRPGV